MPDYRRQSTLQGDCIIDNVILLSGKSEIAMTYEIRSLRSRLLALSLAL